MKVFFTSDQHFGHANSILFDNRPFRNVEEMDATMIERWNKKVTNKDLVYILGDISWHNNEKTCEILEKLKGRKVLIRGNHDKISGKIKHCFEEVSDYKEIVLHNKQIVLCHYPIVFFNKHFYGSYMFYGHVHNSHEWNMTEGHKHELKSLGINCNMFNVGVMIHDYAPVTFEEIIEK